VHPRVIHRKRDGSEGNKKAGTERNSRVAKRQKGGNDGKRKTERGWGWAEEEASTRAARVGNSRYRKTWHDGARLHNALEKFKGGKVKGDRRGRRVPDGLRYRRDFLQASQVAGSEGGRQRKEKNCTRQRQRSSAKAEEAAVR